MLVASSQERPPSHLLLHGPCSEISIRIYIYIHIHTYISTHIYVYTHMSMHQCVEVHICIFTCILYICIYTHG